MNKKLHLENRNFRIPHKKWKVSEEDSELLVSPSGDVWEVKDGEEKGEQLFTWDAAMRETKKAGKRIPTDKEFSELLKTKEDMPNLVLAGYRYTNGTFYYRSVYTYFWSSSESGSNAWTRHLRSGYSTVGRSADDKGYGFSIRCLKDSSDSLPSDVSKIVGKLQDDLTDEVDKYFPKGECTGRGGAILLVGLAVSFIASALTKAKKEAKNEALDKAIEALPEEILEDPFGMDDFIRGSNSGIRACENNLKKLKSK